MIDLQWITPKDIGVYAAGLLTGLFGGSGIVWKILEWRDKKELAKYTRMKTINDLRKDKDQVYADIIKIIEEHLQMLSPLYKLPDESLKDTFNSRTAGLLLRLKLKESNFSVIESSIAELEGRQPEPINLKPFAPAAPTNLHAR